MKPSKTGKPPDNGGEAPDRVDPEVYLVKIYNRRHREDHVAGTLESLATGAKRTFRQARELMELISSGMGKWGGKDDMNI